MNIITSLIPIPQCPVESATGFLNGTWTLISEIHEIFKKIWAIPSIRASAHTIQGALGAKTTAEKTNPLFLHPIEARTTRTYIVVSAEAISTAKLSLLAYEAFNATSLENISTYFLTDSFVSGTRASNGILELLNNNKENRFQKIGEIARDSFGCLTTSLGAWLYFSESQNETAEETLQVFNKTAITLTVLCITNKIYQNRETIANTALSCYNATKGALLWCFKIIKP